MAVFRRLFAAQIVALLGTGLLTVALGLLAYDLAGASAGLVLGTVLAIKMLAYVFVSPLMAALTERLHPRTVLMSADVVRAAVAVLLPFVGQVWQIYLLVFVLQAASATFTPTFQAVIPTVLTDERDYTRGLALSRTAYDLEAMLSPLLAAAVLTVLSYSSLFVATAAGFLVSGVLVYRTAIPDPQRPADTVWRQRVLAGARVMFAHRDLRALLAMNLSVAAATGLVMVNTVVYVRATLGGGEAGVALALAAYGAGSMTVALLTPRLMQVVTDRSAMLVGAGAAAAGLVGTAAVLVAGALQPVVLGALWAFLGAATSLVITPSGRLLARTGGDRTAVYTAQFSLSHAGFLLTYPIAGWVGAGVDQGLAAVILAILATGAAAAAARIICGRGQRVDRQHPEPGELTQPGARRGAGS